MATWLPAVRQYCQALHLGDITDKQLSVGGRGMYTRACSRGSFTHALSQIKQVLLCSLSEGMLFIILPSPSSCWTQGCKQYLLEDLLSPSFRLAGFQKRSQTMLQPILCRHTFCKKNYRKAQWAGNSLLSKPKWLGDRNHFLKEQVTALGLGTSGLDTSYPEQMTQWGLSRLMQLDSPSRLFLQFQI